MEFKLARCTIRDWRMDDAPSLATHANSRRVWLGLRDAFPHPYSIRDANDFLRRTIADEPRKNFCIEIDGEAVGGIGLRPGEDERRHTAQLGYWLAEEFWGRGIMSEVVPAFAKYCFENFWLHRLYAEAYANNPASAGVGKGRLRFRRAIAQQRGQRRQNSRFASLREDDVISRQCITW